MSIDAIYKSIPHRPPFLFIDEILSITENSAIARRTIRADEFYFEGHYPGNPIMPGVLLCESVFQTAAIYLSRELDKTGTEKEGKTPVLSRIREAKFKSMVKPGDTITIEAHKVETLGSFHFMKGKITKDNKVVMTLECVLALVDTGKKGES